MDAEDADPPAVGGPARDARVEGFADQPVERADSPSEPGTRLAPGARTAWRIAGAGNALAVVAAAWGLSRLLGALDAPAGGVDWLVWAVALLAAGVLIGLVPELRWRRWRYEVREDEIDIRHGAFTVKRTLVPMLRVQHVDTTRGPVQQALGLASVQFHTAAGPTEIPNVGRDEGDRLRWRIADLARRLEED